ncbi:Bifunctional protein FolD [Rhynchospora pubera]|uniref:Bifunctional protein FolD n=1 Tax=Rhynchospora pubera TaxID=906938 RepID=A0AAV8GW84_9POAL|nr:Bifunctional protein FolD [Rhynchospora pubera]
MALRWGWGSASASAPVLFSLLARSRRRRCHHTITTVGSGKEEEEEEDARAILGPDLPDIWSPLPTSLPRPIPIPILDISAPAPPTIIDGNSIAHQIRSHISTHVINFKTSYGKVPVLAVILVGHRRDSQTYVRYKIKACNDVGITSLLAQLPHSCSEDDVLHSVTSFNQDPSVHGILVQLPLPQHMDEERILGAVSLHKDVDGFHPLNVGNLALRGRRPLFIPCAAKACLQLLLRHQIDLVGKHAVVIGRSKVVGLPTSLLLQRHHATVSIVHAFTHRPEEITREADIVISAAGVANLVRGSWLKRGVVVIDVGTNPIEDPDSEHGYRLTGDVHFDEAVKVASAITPVPGGVGPVTIAMLLSNTLDAAKEACRSSV